MKLSAAEQDSIISLLTRIYSEIRDIEEEFQLLVGGEDFRCRVEYFHDAIRALSSEDPQSQLPGGRLSVELLAYDLSCLRYIVSMPLAPFKPHGQAYSPKTDIITTKPNIAVKKRRPDRQVRERLGELYQHYSVLFAALLKPMADRDYKDRIDALNQDVEDVLNLVTQLNAHMQGKGSIAKIAEAIQHLEEDELRQQLVNFIEQEQHKKKDNLKKLAEFLKAHAAKKDKEIAAIDAAHMNYALAQLGIFEGSKDMLKKMASQGMNLVGRFVEASVAQSKREMGR